MISIAIADDHMLFRKGLIEIINGFENHQVVLEAANGKELLEHIDSVDFDLVMLDVNMPVMDGIRTAAALSAKNPGIKILALSMMDSESSVISMIRSGARGYLLKDASPAALKLAIADMMKNGFHINEYADGRLFAKMSAAKNPGQSAEVFINPREEEFLKYIITEMTYKEIADQMNVSPRTVDGYRESLFEKLQLKSRVGLVMYALKNGFARIQ